MDITSIQEELHLKDYLAVLRRRRDVVITFFAATVFIVGVGSFIMRPVYRATATILIDPESPNVLTTTGMVELQSQNYLSYKEYYQSQVEMISSRSLARKVFEEFGLGSTWEYEKAKEPVREFLKTIRVEPVRDTRLLKLHVDNRDAELAAKIANRIAELYVMRNLYYISKSELLNLLKNEYLKLETKMSEYAKIYKPAHPEMIRLQNEMTEMMGRIDQEKKSVYNYGAIEEYLIGGAHALAGFKANNISIQDPAEKPVIPLRPKKKLNILLSVIVGLLGGVGLAFFFEYLDDSAKTIEDVERVMPWPFLGNLPDMDASGLIEEFEKDVIVNMKPKDPVAEAYRAIRTSVFFSSVEGRPTQCLLITSSGPQEGKTTTLCNLGIAMAQNKKKVLLVDADMRRPRLHEVFEKENKDGLSGILSGQSRLDEVIQKTGIEDVSLMAGGVIPPNPSELLAGGRMKEFIAKAKEEFDFILLDSPPIGMVTDGVILSRVVDGAIMVVQSGRTSRRALARIYQLLKEANARVVGVVLNKVSVTPGDYYYSYYYGKGKKAASEKS